MNAQRFSTGAVGGDWTKGIEAVCYQTCGRCGHVWYFRRPFCPQCGDTHPQVRCASGRGVVYAVTTVARAPTEALRAAAPYTVALVDCEEAFRILAHAAPQVRIGDAVRLSFRRFSGLLVPYVAP